MSRLVWWWCVLATIALGVLAMIDRWGVAALIVFVAFGALLGAVVAANIWTGDDVDRAGRKITVTTLCGAVLGPAAVGLFSAFGSTALLIALCLVATSSPVVRFVRTRWFTVDGTGDDTIEDTTKNTAGDTADGEPAREETSYRKGTTYAESANDGPVNDEPVDDGRTGLEHLDAEALCLAWRRSFIRLAAATTPAERLSVVEQRQRYLDELHRRSPDGLAAWFAAGARASGDPPPYVADDHRPLE